MIPLNEQAYHHLRRLIRSDTFEYNKIYSETRISKELGISRTPLRDAIHRLSQEGYIDIIPSKGFMIHHLNQKDVIETFQVRSALETYCTYQISKEADCPKAADLFEKLDEIMGHMYQIMVTTHSIEEFCEYDFQFHMMIINYLDNQQLSSVFDAYMYHMVQLAKLSLAHEGRMEDTYEEHIAILTGMRNGDTEHIFEITLRHMDTPKAINLSDLL